jgi:5-deoxy-glucuronate isomerase
MCKSRGMAANHVQATAAGRTRVAVTPASARWRCVSFAVHELQPGERHHALLADQETALVPLSGRFDISLGGSHSVFERESVFAAMPRVAYAPPGVAIEITATTVCSFAIGSAPAVGRYPARVFEPAEMKSELRGGGTAFRQVNHILAMPLPAEHLILYEVYVPRGTWAGWAPHCHDGRDGSPYLEEVYYFRQDPPEGFILHRNWRDDEGFDETFAVADGDVVLVPKGFHSTVACPTSHMYFLNYLAGDLVGDERATPPCFNAQYTWIQDDWSKNAWTLPVVGPTARPSS